MGWVDKVPRAGNLYIGGLHALYQTDLIRAAGITHVVSVLDYDALLQEKFPALAHFAIRAEDHPRENLLQWFAEGVGYIDRALHQRSSSRSSSSNILSVPGKTGQEEERDSGGGGVFVHCAMGKSRSAALVVAYLMWKFQLDPATALAQLCEGRPVCDPNPGFKEQLRVWGEMCKIGDEDGRKRVYESWEKTRFMGEYWEWGGRSRGVGANL